jgi:hypothetical protein
MIPVDHCKANAHGFGLEAFNDWEEFAVPAGAPDDFLRAHLVSFVSAEVMFSVCDEMTGSGLTQKRVKIDSGVGWLVVQGFDISNICVQSSKLTNAIIHSDHCRYEILPRLNNMTIDESVWQQRINFCHTFAFRA